MDIGEQVNRLAQVRAAREAAQVEEMCERSLLDPEQRGVWVDGHGVASLDERVPYGEIHYMQRIFL